MQKRTQMANRHRRPASWLLGERPDLKDWHKALDRLDGSYSPYTLLSYRADFASFEAWCLEKGLTSLPAQPDTVALLIAHEIERLKPTTLKRKLAGLRKVYHLLRSRIQHATSKSTLPSDAHRGRSRSAQHSALLRTCATGCSPYAPRIWLASATAPWWLSASTRGELVSLRVEDIQPNHFGTASLLIRRRKNDPNGNGRIAHLTKNALQALKSWLEAASMKDGPSFRPVHQNHVVDRHINPIIVGRVLKGLAAMAGEMDDISVHSLRVGAAQQLTMNGPHLLPIMRAGAGVL